MVLSFTIPPITFLMVQHKGIVHIRPWNYYHYGMPALSALYSLWTRRPCEFGTSRKIYNKLLQLFHWGYKNYRFTNKLLLCVSIN